MTTEYINFEPLFHLTTYIIQSPRKVCEDISLGIPLTTVLTTTAYNQMQFERHIYHYIV